MQKSYLEDMERQHVDLMKMLDPKARWPNGRDKMVGLDLLNVGKLATERDQKKRPDVTEVCGLVFRCLHKPERSFVCRYFVDYIH